MNKTFKVLIGIIVTIVVVLLSITIISNIVSGQMQKNLNKNSERYKVTRGDLLLTAIGSGKISSSNFHSVMPSGNITEIKVNIGDYVKKGDVIAEFTNVLGQSADFTSEYNGVISSIPGAITESNPTSPSTSFEISDSNKLLLNIQVTENDVYKVKINQKANVYLDALNLTLRGIVSHISQNGETAGDFSVYEVTVEFDKISDNIYLGMSGSAKIQVENKKNVLKVPVDAIIEKGDKRFLLNSEWLKNSNSPRSDYYIEVKTGLSDSDYVEVIKGDIEGKEILITNDTKVGFPFLSSSSDDNKTD